MTTAPSSSSSSLAIGIDLGTTYSCVGVWRRGAVEIIPNEFGHRTTPSYVSFHPNERIVGDAAKLNVSSNPLNTVFDAKRLIGRKFTDGHIQNDIKHWTFKVVDSGGADAKPMIAIDGCGASGDRRLYSAEEISSMILSKMKLSAEEYLQQKVTNAVITVPAYFNDAQRQATKDAGAIAGLNVMRIINEPTAAAIAYGLEAKRKREEWMGMGNTPTATPKSSVSSTPNASRSVSPLHSSSPSPSLNILIFDLGGGTFDVSLLQVTDGVFHVKSTAGDTHLGGEDFDQTIMEYFLKEIEQSDKWGGKAVRMAIEKDEKKMRRLKSACEKAKCSISTVDTAFIELDHFIPSETSSTFTASLSRATFETLCEKLFQTTLQPVEQVLRDSQMDKADVDEIVLVGGSTRIPRVQQMISEFFGGKSLNKSINPDEAVAYGAAVQAAILNGSINEEIKDILLIDITPMSLGLETVGGVMQRIIPRNSIIPCKFKQVFSTHVDNQEMVEIAIYEGERVRTMDNNLLGIFELRNLPAKPSGVPIIEVTFEIDSNGIMSVMAVERSTGVTERIVIENRKGRMKKEEIRKVMEEEERWHCKEMKWMEMTDKRRGLEKLACYMRMMKNGSSAGPDESLVPCPMAAEVKLSTDEENTLEGYIKDICEFVGRYDDLSEEVVMVENIEERIKEIEEKQREMEEKCNPIVEKAYKGNVPILC